MKTLLAIALAAAVLTIGTATVAPISGPAIAAGTVPGTSCSIGRNVSFCPPNQTPSGLRRGR